MLLDSQMREIHAEGIQKGEWNPLSSVALPPLQESAEHSGSLCDYCLSLFLVIVLYSIIAWIIIHWWSKQVWLLAPEAGQGGGSEDEGLQIFNHDSFFLETSYYTGGLQPSVISLANKGHPWDFKELKSCMPGDRWKTNILFPINGQYHTSPNLSSFEAPLW